MLDKLLEKTGLKYEDLNPIEKETLNTWIDALQKGVVSVPKIKEYITSMKEAVEAELTKSDLGTKQDLFLKARLRNYMLLDSFLSTPERAKEQIENAIAGIVSKK
jgi:hypothetical protein